VRVPEAAEPTAEAWAAPDVRRVGVALGVGVRVVPAMICDPVRYGTLDCHAPEDRERGLNGTRRIEASVCEEPV
jgi:hypothetical protein